MKTSKIDAVVAEMTNEKRLLGELLEEFEWEAEGLTNLEGRIRMLNAMIARLTNGATPAAPKPTRTRKGKAGLPKPELGL